MSLIYPLIQNKKNVSPARKAPLEEEYIRAQIEKARVQCLKGWGANTLYIDASVDLFVFLLYRLAIGKNRLFSSTMGELFHLAGGDEDATTALENYAVFRRVASQEMKIPIDNKGERHSIERYGLLISHVCGLVLHEGRRFRTKPKAIQPRKEKATRSVNASATAPVNPSVDGGETLKMFRECLIIALDTTDLRTAVERTHVALRVAG